jgi:hypothetical protein
LEHLSELSTEDFLFLLVGMLDNTSPELTEPREDQATRLTREAHARAVERAKGR